MKVIQNNLVDQLGRKFVYLRLSLTDACNFSCQYCLPNGFKRQALCGNSLEDTLLNLNEIENLVNAFAELGFVKVRLTGGEPTLRKDIVGIVSKIALTPGIQTIALTTNGYRLNSIVTKLHAAGLNAINISLDSLNRERFKEITGSDSFERVYCGVQQALAVGIERVKVNVVLLKSYIEKDLESFIDFVKDQSLSVRFIELMQTGDNTEYFKKEYYSGDEFRNQLQARGWKELERTVTGGPAREFRHPLYKGNIGVIAPYSKDFCASCNRLRISSRGKLKLCLFGDGQHSLREYLQNASQREELKAKVCELIGIKLPSHLLHQGIYGTTQHLASIGG